MVRAFLALLLSLTALIYSTTASQAEQFADGLVAYRRGDYATAQRFWAPLADQGNAEAENGLGVMYAAGLGVPQDYATAVMWYRKAADQEYPSGQSNLGVMYYFGQGVPRITPRPSRGFARPPIRATSGPSSVSGTCTRKAMALLPISFGLASGMTPAQKQALKTVQGGRHCCPSG